MAALGSPLHSFHTKEVDYCYIPEGVALPTSPPEEEVTQADLDQEHGVSQSNAENGMALLNSEIKKCSEGSPCEICTGDCDLDAQCAGSLICFQRPWHKPYKPVPGCLGQGVAGRLFLATISVFLHMHCSLLSFFVPLAGADYCVEP